MAGLELTPDADHYGFARNLQRLTESLPPSVRLLGYLCSRLDLLLDTELGERLRDKPVDLSTTWRREIGMDQLGHEYDPKSVIVTSILRTAARWVDAGLDVRELLAVTRARQRWLFRRIELELVRRFGDEELKPQYLLDENLFRLASTRREYLDLLRDGCASLNRPDMEQVTRFVESEDMVRFRQTYESMMGRAPSDQEVERHVQGWRLMWLGAMRDCLDAAQSAELAELEDANPVATSVGPATASVTAGGGGLTDEQVQAVGTAGLIEFVQRHSGVGDIDVDVLFRQLREAVTTGPDDFEAIEADDLAALDPTFVQSLLSGLEQVLRESRAIPWGFGRTLIDRAVADGPIPERGGSPFDYDRDWTAAKCAAASLLSTVLATTTLPADDSQWAWEVIERLSADPNPGAEDERAFDGPATTALNTVRPRALAAAIDYASWRKAAEGTGGMHGHVAELLVHHLMGDEAASVRSVFGLRLTDLVIIDEAWVREHLTAIFGARLIDATLGRVAWSNFLQFNQPHQQLFDLLAAYYEDALDTIASPAWDGAVITRLAYHLGVLYLWGKLDLAADGLTSRFFERAPLDARRYLLETLGHILGANPEPPTDVGERLRAIWEWREQEVEAGRGTAEELGTFGWWFGSGRLPDDWALAHLQTAVRLAKAVYNEPRVAERLTSLAATNPVEVIATIEIVLSGDGRTWVIYSWDEAIRAAVSGARSGTEAAKEMANEFLSRLLAAGYVQYSHLVE